MTDRRRFWMAAALLAMAWGCSNDTPTGSGNLPPRIISLNASPSSLVMGGESRVTALVSDPDNDPLHITWSSTGGVFGDATRASTTWRAPATAGSYKLILSVSDGQESVIDSVDVEVGNASLTVISSPPRALITLDGTATGHPTPYTFNPLPVGFHGVSLFSQYYRYQNKPGVELVNGESDTIRFVLPPATQELVDPGRSDILELGGVAFLPSGLGFLYVARTPTETAVFSDPLIPAAGSPHGVRVVGPVRLEEPISIGIQGPNLFFISPGDSLFTVPIRDRNQDGVVDSVGAPALLHRQGYYGPAVSTTNDVAYSLTPSEEPTSLPLFYAHYNDPGLGTQLSASHTWGKLPSWKPGESVLAYQYLNTIVYSIVSTFGAPSGDTLYAQDFNTAPSWGKWGAKTVAFLHGVVDSTYTDLMLTANNAPDAVTVARNLADPRFIAWSPLEELLVLTEHPGGRPQFLIVSSLPIP